MYDITGIQRTLAWCLGCVCLHYLSFVLSKIVVPNFKSLPASSQRSWYNRSVSTIHAIVMLCGSLYYWVYINPERLIGANLEEFSCLLMDVMMGYLWYDIFYEFSTSCSVDTLAHHILGLISHMSTRIFNSGATGYYSMMVYLAEASTPLLNISWLLHQLHLKDTLLFQICAFSLVILFFCCRVVLGPYMIYHFLSNGSSWDANELNWMYYLNFIIIVLFTLLNMYWFYKLVGVASSSSSSSSSSPRKKVD